MGAWGHGSFANDDALDWVGTLSHRGLSTVVAALSAVPDSDDDYLEAPTASAAIAAAEVVAAQAGNPADKLPDKVSEWVKSQSPAGPELVALARQAVERVLRLSELRDLWDEPEDSEAWQSEVSALLARL